MKVATCIKWDYEGYDDIILPTEIELPDEVVYAEDNEIDYESIDNYLSDTTGFCHEGYILEDVE